MLRIEIPSKPCKMHTSVMEIQRAEASPAVTDRPAAF